MTFFFTTSASQTTASLARWEPLADFPPLLCGWNNSAAQAFMGWNQRRLSPPWLMLRSLGTRSSVQSVEAVTRSPLPLLLSEGSQVNNMQFNPKGNAVFNLYFYITWFPFSHPADSQSICNFFVLFLFLRVHPKLRFYLPATSETKYQIKCSVLVLPGWAT